MAISISEIVKLKSEDFRGQRQGRREKVQKADARTRKSKEAWHIDEV